MQNRDGRGAAGREVLRRRRISRRTPRRGAGALSINFAPQMSDSNMRASTATSNRKRFAYPSRIALWQTPVRVQITGPALSGEVTMEVRCVRQPGRDVARVGNRESERGAMRARFGRHLSMAALLHTAMPGGILQAPGEERHLILGAGRQLNSSRLQPRPPGFGKCAVIGDRRCKVVWLSSRQVAGPSVLATPIPRGWEAKLTSTCPGRTGGGQRPFLPRALLWCGILDHQDPKLRRVLVRRLEAWNRAWHATSDNLRWHGSG